MELSPPFWSMLKLNWKEGIGFGEVFIKILWMSMPPPKFKKKTAAWLKFLEQALYLSYCPTFTKLARIVHLALRIDLKELDAESDL